MPPRQNSQYIDYVAPEAQQFLYIFSQARKISALLSKKTKYTEKTKPKILNQTPQEKKQKRTKKNQTEKKKPNAFRKKTNLRSLV